MAERPFLAKGQRPDNAVLEAALGPAFVFYRDLAGLCGGFKPWRLGRTGGPR